MRAEPLRRAGAELRGVCQDLTRWHQDLGEQAVRTPTVPMRDRGGSGQVCLPWGACQTPAPCPRVVASSHRSHSPRCRALSSVRPVLLSRPHSPRRPPCLLAG